MENELFADLIRSAGDLAGVFEYDGETGYFYLYRATGADGAAVLDHIHIVSGQIDFAANEVVVLWDDPETKVGLSIRNTVWAIFDCVSGQKFGGNYRLSEKPAIPETVSFVTTRH
jgi:hypothetical protein